MRGLKWFALGALSLPAMACLPAPAFAEADSQPQDNAASTSAGKDSTYSIATGFDYSAGHYGAAADTTVYSIPLDLKAQFGRFRLQASLPYEFINGPGQLVAGVIISAPGGVTTSRSGIGDLSLSAAYTLVREQGALPTIEIGGSVKAPTAKSTIGTGKTDYSVTASLYKTILPSATLFGSVGYSWLGSPAAYQLRDGILASGGLNIRPTPSQNLGVSVAYREPIVTGLKGQAVVSPYYTLRINRPLGLTLYGLAGLNDASPRIGAGLRLTLFE